jgi:hypothetical protein
MDLSRIRIGPIDLFLVVDVAVAADQTTQRYSAVKEWHGERERSRRGLSDIGFVIKNTEKQDVRNQIVLPIIA